MAQDPSGLPAPPMQNLAEVFSVGARLNAIARLLDLGAIQTQFTKFDEGNLVDLVDEHAELIVRYVATSFGKVLFDYVAEQMGLTDPKLRDQLKQLARKYDKPAQ